MRESKSTTVFYDPVNKIQVYAFCYVLFPSFKNRWQAKECWFGVKTNTIRRIMVKSRDKFITDEEYKKMWEELD